MREGRVIPTLLPIEFWQDYLALLRSRLKEMGFRNYEGFDDSQFDIRFHDAVLRLVEPRPRTIQYAKGFELPAFAEAHRKGFDLLTDKIRRGDSVWLHLSKDTFDLGTSDGLLLDWNVHHLHLGEDIDPKTSRITRTGPVLYARFEEDDAYFLGVMNHGEWANEDLAEILINEWPQLVGELNRIQGAPEGTKRVTAEERKFARKRGLQNMYQAKNGKVYVCGWGYSTARTSMRGTMRADRTRELIRFNQERMTTHFVAWCEEVARKGMSLPSTVRLRLSVDDDGDLCAVVQGLPLRWPFAK